MSSDNQDNNRQVATLDNRSMVTVEHIKNVFICEGLTAEEIGAKLNLPVHIIDGIITDSKLVELRKAHIKHGLEKLHNVQLTQAEKMLNIDTQFKKMRLVQLEKTLEDFVAYFSKHGHFYRVHPTTGDPLKDLNGIPMQIKIPDVTREINAIKETFSLSEGLKNLLSQLDGIINPKGPKADDTIPVKDIIDVKSYEDLFKRRSEVDED